MPSILAIGDCHVGLDKSLDRFDLVSNLIWDRKPDYIVIMGDFMDMDCLSRWDKDKRQKMEGRRYYKEIAQGNEALDRLFRSVMEGKTKARRSKRKSYFPGIIYLEGNHEERLRRYLEYDPTFEGHVTIPKDMCLKDRGILWVPYREYYYINDIGFTHIPHNKIKPISGIDVTTKAMKECTTKSVVFGHTHELAMSNRHVEGMPHLQQSLNVGCFIDRRFDYTRGKVTNYWRGVILMYAWKPGRFDINTFSLGELERVYG